MADHSKPTVTSTYANYTSELDGRLDDLALGFDPATTSPTNVPTNAIRWASASNKWQKWNGSSWGDLSGSYSININGTVGATTPAAGSFTNASYTGTLTGGSGVVNIGSGQVYKDASGLVGIGTSAPADKLSVVGTTNREYVRVESTFSSSGSEAGIRLKTAGTNGKEYLIFNANTEGSLRIYDATAASERMRIDSNGLVGIGTSSPSYKLEVKGAAATAGQLSIHDGTGDTVTSGNNAASLLFQARDSSIRTIAEIDAIHTTTNGTGGAMVFQTRVSDTLAERMRIDSAGSLLVNTTAGYGKFTVASTAGTGKVLLDNYATVPTSENVISIYADATNGYIQSYNNAYKNIVICGSGGNVGIGTTSISGKLSINGEVYAAAGSVSGVAYGFYPKGTYGNTGMFSPAANTVAFATTGGERVRIDSSGRVGIGTTSPDTLLNIQGLNPTLLIQDSDEAGDGFIKFQTANGTQRGYIQTAMTSNVMIFGTGTSERVRIDSSGNLLVGCTSLPGGGTTGTAFQLGASISGMCTWTNRSSTTAASDHAYFYNPNGIVGFIRTTSSATSYSTSSDYRLKEAIAPMTGALATVAALKPVTYKWKADGSDGQGFIAHELQEVVPDCVHGEKDAVDAGGNPQYQGIDTSFLVATLTAAIQEQQAIIESLTARVSALEGN
jgi:hypothetical protein